MNAIDPNLPPCLAQCEHPAPPIDDDELPPWLGERMRDAFHDIFRADFEAHLEEQEPAR